MFKIHFFIKIRNDSNDKFICESLRLQQALISRW